VQDALQVLRLRDQTPKLVGKGGARGTKMVPFESVLLVSQRATTVTSSA